MARSSAMLISLLVFAPTLQGSSTTAPARPTQSPVATSTQTVEEYLADGTGGPAALVGTMYQPSESATRTLFYLGTLECVTRCPLPDDASDGARVEVELGGFESGAQIVTKLKVLEPAFAAGLKADLAAQGLTLFEGGFGELQVSEDTTSVWQGYVSDAAGDRMPDALISISPSALADARKRSDSAFRLYTHEGFTVAVIISRFTPDELSIVDRVLGPETR